MGSKKKAKAPNVGAAEIGKDIQSYVSGFQGQLPTILGSERQYRPEFQGLNLGDISAFLGGVGGQQGLFDIGSLATEESQRQLQAARQAEILGMTGQAGIGRGLMETLSPARAEAAQAGGRAFELGQTFYTAPLLSMLGGAPTSYTAGQQQVGLGLGAIGAGTPQLYDIGTALNIGAANRSNQVAASAANAQASASRSAGLMQAGGSIAGAGITAFAI
jgi:hypothetical protein